MKSATSPSGAACDRVSFLRPDLDARQRTDGDDVAFDSGVGRAASAGHEYAALAIARDFLCVGEDVAHEAGGSARPYAAPPPGARKTRPRSRWVEREARIGLRRS